MRKSENLFYYVVVIILGFYIILTKAEKKENKLPVVEVEVEVDNTFINNKLYDSILTTIVESELIQYQFIPYEMIHVEIVNHIVTLTGWCDNIYESRKVHEIVKDVPGVKGVVNQIQVKKTDYKKNPGKKSVRKKIFYTPQVVKKNMIALEYEKEHIFFRG